MRSRNAVELIARNRIWAARGAAFLALAAACQVATTQTPAPAPVRPGPDILYEAPATSPQLENKGIWKADPILISGVSAYRKGEFLYQDYLYDDRGAGQRALYPPDRAKYAGNAADFVEVRLKPLASETAVRITYNSMIDPSLVAATIAFGESVPQAALPFGAGGTEPATIFVTVYGSEAVITDAATGKELPAKAAVAVDQARRQVEIRVPYAAFDPRNKTNVRVAAGAGLWDAAKNAYLTPGDSPVGQGPEPGAAPPAGRGPAPGDGRGAPARGPGGAPGAAGGVPGGRQLAPPNPARSLFMNVAFRYHEPLNTNSVLAFYSDVQQGDQLMKGDLSPFFASVDFVKLAAGKDDNSQVPTKGFMSRILVSHFEAAQGRGAAGMLGKGCTEPCVPEFAGRLQPYEIYVPNKPAPAAGYGLTIDLHSASANYARWLGGDRHIEFGERGTGSIVFTANGRGLTSNYLSEAAADPFEVWADVARLYKIDKDYVSLAGVSMGAMGAQKFAGMFPDLFAAMAVSVGCPNDPVLVNTREVPIFTHTGDADTNTDCRPGNAVLERMLGQGEEYQWWNFLQQPHGFSSIPRNWQPFADFLGVRKRATDPAHVTYAVNADFVQEKFGINPDHAYWISGVRIRDENHKLVRSAKNGPVPGSQEPPAFGVVDVVSHGMGKGDPEMKPVQKSSGVFKFGVESYSWPNYNSQEQTREAAPSVSVADAIDIKAENIAAVTIDPKRAKVTCAAKISVQSDGPIDVKMLGCSKVNVTMTK